MFCGNSASMHSGRWPTVEDGSHSSHSYTDQVTVCTLNKTLRACEVVLYM